MRDGFGAIAAALMWGFAGAAGLDEYGYKRCSSAGAGTARRIAREKVYREQQAERLKDATPAKITRQQLRRIRMGRR